MSLTAISVALEVGGKLIDRLFPDPTAKAAAQLELIKLQESGDLARLAADVQLAKAQTDVNAIEAASSRLFVAGWRPWIGWICGTGFGVQFVIGPIGEWVAALAGHPIKFPQMDLSEMIPLLGALLGLGGFRTFEKVKKVA